MKTHHVAAVAALCLGLAVTSRASATDGETGSALSEGSSSYGALFTGQQLISDSGYYHLVMQEDGNLVEYADCGNYNAVWANNKAGSGSGYAGGIFSTYVVLQNDGNLVEYADPSGVVWASNTPTGLNSRLWLQDDGNLVIYKGSGGTWATGTHGSYGDPHCAETASFTTVWPNWVATTGGTKLSGGNYDFAECGNLCATESTCTSFSFTPGIYSVTDWCQTYSSFPSFTQSGASGSYVGTVTKSAPPGN